MRIKLLVGSHYYFEQKRELLTITVNKAITVIIIMRKLLTPKNHDLQNTCIKYMSFLLYYKIFSESC